MFVLLFSIKRKSKATFFNEHLISIDVTFISTALFV